MKILLCNDDGIYAEGINTLYEVLSEIGEVTVVAPLEEKSATGQTLTLDHPVRIEKIKDNFYGINGFPADCSLMGIVHILDQRPDVLVSGINRGANLGQDIYYSGTVAAARQGTFHNIPSIAVSTVLDFKPHDHSEIHFKTAANFIKKLLLEGKHMELDNKTMLNINVPDLPEDQIEGFEITTLGQRQYSEEVSVRKDFRGREYYWIGGVYQGHSGSSDCDCAAIDNNKISINPLNLFGDCTDTLRKWSEILNK